mmetsp:Transcript_43530/g.44215  ORF Transcript_43530/g.44215 Transcript_43530/m.44215 type:complete len:110 (+) Transcript_43530:509-838(+)
MAPNKTWMSTFGIWRDIDSMMITTTSIMMILIERYYNSNMKVRLESLKLLFFMIVMTFWMPPNMKREIELDWTLKKYLVNNDNIDDTNLNWILKRYRVDNDIINTYGEE